MPSTARHFCHPVVPECISSGSLSVVCQASSSHGVGYTGHTDGKVALYPCRVGGPRSAAGTKDNGDKRSSAHFGVYLVIGDSGCYSRLARVFCFVG